MVVSAMNGVAFFKESDQGTGETLMHTSQKPSPMDIPPSLPAELAKLLMARYKDTLIKYGRRNPESNIFDPGTERLDRDAVESEVYGILSRAPSPVMAKALRDGDAGVLQRFLQGRCLSHFRDGGRDPRYKAIRVVLFQAGREGKLHYRAGRGIFPSGNAPRGESAEQFHHTSFAFGDEEHLEQIPVNLLSMESYGNWPLPPELDGSSGDRPRRQNDMVMIAASFFWEQVRRRHGPYWLPVAELQRYLQAVLPPWYLNEMLPDPMALWVEPLPHDPESDGDEGKRPDPMPPTPVDYPPYGRPDDEPLIEFERIHKTVIGLAQKWIAELTELNAKQPVLFCLVFHCHKGTTETARILGFKSPQNADQAYNRISRRMKTFCSRHDGLGEPGLDRDLVMLFFQKLHILCAERILTEGCP